MSSKFITLKYPTLLQIEIWLLKRNKMSGVQIARTKQISRATVSKTLKKANERVKSLLENAARMNKIHLDILNEDRLISNSPHTFDLDHGRPGLWRQVLGNLGARRDNLLPENHGLRHPSARDHILIEAGCILDKTFHRLSLCQECASAVASSNQPSVN